MRQSLKERRISKWTTLASEVSLMNLRKKLIKYSIPKELKKLMLKKMENKQKRKNQRK